MRPPRRPTSGFTLIEISLVAALIGFLLLIGAHKFDAMTPERSLASGARMLRATLEEMHGAVLLRGRTASLVYDFPGNAYRLEFPPDQTAASDLVQGPPGTPPPSEVLLEGRLPDGVVFKRILRRGVPDQTDGELKLPLTPGGSCPAHGVLLGLSSGDAAQTLRVDPLLGTVTVYPEAKTFDQLFTFMPDSRDPPVPPTP